MDIQYINPFLKAITNVFTTMLRATPERSPMRISATDDSGSETLTGVISLKTPVMMVTTESEKERVVQAIRSGANDYLVKPFESHVVAEKIQKLVAQYA